MTIHPDATVDECMIEIGTLEREVEMLRSLLKESEKVQAMMADMLLQKNVEIARLKMALARLKMALAPGK